MPIATTSVIPDLEELTITYHIEGLNPTLFNYEFLTCMGIVPTEWELESDPIINEAGSVIHFINGVGIYAEPDNISFVQGITSTSIMYIADVATNFLNKMSNTQFTGISISPKFIVTFPEYPDAAKDFLNNNLVQPGNWKNLGEVSPSPAVNIAITLDEYLLTLNISTALFFESEEVINCAILFIGKYFYDFTVLKREVHNTKASFVISNLNILFNDFRDLIYRRLLGKTYTI